MLLDKHYIVSIVNIDILLKILYNYYFNYSKYIILLYI